MKIQKYKPIEHPSVKASFSILMEEWGDLMINDCKLFEKGTSRWISLPSRQYEAEGEKRYYNIVTFATIEKVKAFQAQVLAAIDAMLSDDKHKPADPAIMPF